MFNPEKPKGLPGSRGIAYLVTGIVIGVLGVLGVMFLLTLSACACEPQPNKVDIPLIPTPIPGATGTAAAAQSVSAIRLEGFKVDETRQQIVLSYSQAERVTLDVHTWSNADVGERITTLSQGGLETFDDFQFHPTESLVLASGKKDKNGETTTTTFAIDNQLPHREALEQITTYSPDGHWEASWSERLSHVTLFQTSGASNTLNTVSTGGMNISDVAFSHDSSKIVVLGEDPLRQSHMYIRLYSVNLKFLKEFYITQEYGRDGDVMFTLDDMAVVVRTQEAVYKMDVATGDYQYFEIGSYTEHVSVDSTSRWLAVSKVSRQRDKNDTYTLRLYDLFASDHLLPDSSQTYTIPGGYQSQFLNDGSLLVGSQDATLTLYRWTGETWSDPTVIMTAADLE